MTGTVQRVRGKECVAAVTQQHLDPFVVSLERKVLEQFTAIILNYKKMQEESEWKPRLKYFPEFLLSFSLFVLFLCVSIL